MDVRPSDILYSQDSISNYFDQKCRHSNILIGETLDDICTGKCSVRDIPQISVTEIDGKWVSADNRRLWVFRQLERLGKCDKIRVRKTHYIPDDKMTSGNGGNTIKVRRNPGGVWYLKQSRNNSVVSPATKASKSNTTYVCDQSGRRSPPFRSPLRQIKAQETIIISAVSERSRRPSTTQQKPDNQFVSNSRLIPNYKSIDTYIHQATCVQQEESEPLIKPQSTSRAETISGRSSVNTSQSTLKIAQIEYSDEMNEENQRLLTAVPTGKATIYKAPDQNSASLCLCCSLQ